MITGWDVLIFAGLCAGHERERARRIGSAILRGSPRACDTSHCSGRSPVNAYLGGDEATGKALLRDVINATVGFEPLAAELGKPGKSLHRMLGPGGVGSARAGLARVLVQVGRVQ